MEVPRETHKAKLWNGESVDIQIHKTVPYRVGQKLLNDSLGKSTVKKGSEAEISADAIFTLQESFFDKIWCTDNEHDIDDVNVDESAQLMEAMNIRFAEFQSRYNVEAEN